MVVGAVRDIALVTMPFAPMTQPSLALTLLKQRFEPGRARIHYETLEFVELLGADAYLRIADGEPSTTHLLGEWVFAEAAFGVDVERDRLYADEFLAPSRASSSGGDPAAVVDDELRTTAMLCRELVSGYMDAALARVLEHHPRVVGFTSVFQQNVASLALARRIKEERPDVTVVMGGANCEGPMGVALLKAYDWVDVVVSGEGELAFEDIVDSVTASRRVINVAGATSRHDLGPLSVRSMPRQRVEIDMDELGVPEYADFFESWGSTSALTGRTPYLLFESARGCWWGAIRHCTFCGLNGDRMAFRSKTPAVAVAELCELTAAHPGLPVYAVDNIMDRAYFEEFLPALASSTCDARIFYEVKANLTKDQLRRLRDAGVRDIQPGIESLSDEALRLMRKGVTALENIQLLKWCRELGIRPLWNILWGFPGEGGTACAEMSALLPSLTHLPPPGSAGPIRLDRFSPNHAAATEHGFGNVRPVPAYRAIYGLGDDLLDELAYFFAFDDPAGSPGAPTRQDVADLSEAIGRWQAAYPTSGLWSVEADDSLVIWDFRDETTSFSTQLSGLDRDVYETLDRCTSIGELGVTASKRAGREITDGELRAVLDPLVDAGLVVTDGRRHLALAVRVGERQMPPRFLARLGSELVAEVRAGTDG